LLLGMVLDLHVHSLPLRQAMVGTTGLQYLFMVHGWHHDKILDVR